MTKFSLLLAGLAIFSSSVATAQGASVLTIKDGVIFPAARLLTHAEDGVALPDGRVIVGDWNHGLLTLTPDGNAEPFGDFAAAGFKTRPAPNWNSPNGISMEPNGTHLLVADITSGHIYRVELATGAVKRLYDHDFGVNSVVRDSAGAVWFTQSTRNPEGAGSEERMFAAADRPMADGALYRLPPEELEKDNPQAELKVWGLDFANGLVIDQVRGRLYVAEVMANRILGFDLDPASGTLSNRQVLLEVATPDNIEMDREGHLWIASPIANAIYVYDPDTLDLRPFFEADAVTGRRLAREAIERIARGQGVLDLIGPPTFGPMPGLLTGVILSPDGMTVYASGLGDALVRLDR